MICKFCGLNNPDDALVCSRCGTPLLEGERPMSTPQQVQASDKKTMFLNRKAPVAEEQPVSAGEQPVSSAASGQMVHECGYPLLPGTQVCPNCHKPVTMPAQQEEPRPVDPKKTMRMPVGQSSPASQPNEQVRRDAEVRYNPAQQPDKRTQRDIPGSYNSVPQVDKRTQRDVPIPSNDKKTIHDVLHAQKEEEPVRPQENKRTVIMSHKPAQAQAQEPVNKKTTYGFPKTQADQEMPEVREMSRQESYYCSLKPTTRSEEPESMLVKKEFETGTVVLNRANTEPDNFSITSREQAVLTCENGVWFIEDHSSLQTTFVHVSRKMPLQDGDVILMGDREFVFSTKKER